MNKQTHYINGLPIDKLLYKNYSKMLIKIKRQAKTFYHKRNEYCDSPNKPGAYCVTFYSLNLHPMCLIRLQ